MHQVQRKLLCETKHEIAIDFKVNRFPQEGYPFLKGFRQIWQRIGRKVGPVLPEQSDSFLEELSAEVYLLGIEVRQRHQLIRLSDRKRIIVLVHISERFPHHVQIHAFEM